jgi:hypothetical protein
MVGTFKSVQAANDAQAELLKILQAIDAWHRNHPEESLQREGPDPTPPEVEYATHYGVEWPTTIDWIDAFEYKYPDKNPNYLNQTLISRSVTAVGNLVFASNPYDTWMTVHPFKGLLEYFGALIVGYDFFSQDVIEKGDPVGSLSFTAPDEVTAEKLFSAFTTYLNGPLVSSDNLPPWRNDAENFTIAFQRGTSLQRKSIEALIDEWQSRHDLAVDIKAPFERLERERLERLALFRGGFSREKLRFRLNNFQFYNIELGLAALIAYLETLGCTDINMEFAWVERKDE